MKLPDQVDTELQHESLLASTAHCPRAAWQGMATLLLPRTSYYLVPTGPALTGFTWPTSGPGSSMTYGTYTIVVGRQRMQRKQQHYSSARLRVSITDHNARVSFHPAIHRGLQGSLWHALHTWQTSDRIAPRVGAWQEDGRVHHGVLPKRCRAGKMYYNQYSKRPTKGCGKQ